jgi:hypothetical protein
MERGLHEESISGLTGAWAATWWPSDDGEEAMVGVELECRERRRRAGRGAAKTGRGIALL